jgi:hypothetical protein
VHTQNIKRKTIAKCNRGLEGKYGFKRYLRDFKNHVLEDISKPFYDPSEVKVYLDVNLIEILINFLRILTEQKMNIESILASVL